MNAVVSQAFILAAESGLKTHTKDGTRILCDISDEELKTKSKILRLLPNRECQVALCAFGDESEAMPDYMTSRVPIDMSRTALEVIEFGGYPSQTRASRDTPPMGFTSEAHRRRARTKERTLKN